MAKVTRKDGPGKMALLRLIREAKDKHIKVGFLPSATYENGVPVAYIAIIHEKGCATKGIPPRPFLGPTIDRCGKGWRSMAVKMAGQVLKGQMTITQMLEQLGLVAAGNVAETIAQKASPPLKEKTVEARKRKRLRGFKVGSFTKPLQESGVLFNSVTSSPVYEGKGE